jgi:hypothetical protein
MSIATMVALGVQRQHELAEPPVTRGGDQPTTSDSTKKSVDSAMEKISSFIPSEVIGVYVAGFGIFSPESSAGKWWIFGICALLVPVFIALNYIQQRSHSDDFPSVRIAFILLFFGLVAFIAWAAAMPGTPFLSLTPIATAIGGWAVLILAGIMHKVADILGVVPKKS